MPRESLALRLTAFTQRWLPDAFVFALLATLVVFVVGLASGAAPSTLVDAWGKGFWELSSFAMQMAIVVIGGHLVADTPSVRRVIARLADIPTNSKNAAAFVAFVAMTTSWLNWGFGLVFAAVLARAIADRQSPRCDYRALGAATLLGLGSVWAQGLSGSAALQMATASALPDRIRAIVAADGVIPGGVLPFSQTIFLWQSFVSVLVEIVIVTAVVYVITPADAHAQDRAMLGIVVAAPEPALDNEDAPRTPGERLEHSTWLSLAIAALGLVFVVSRCITGGVNALTLETINLTLLTLGILGHRTPARLMRAFGRATPAVASVLLQFPFYAGIAGMLAATALNEHVAAAFVGVANRYTFPALMALYSMLLGVFVPSGGSKWLIEAPYVLRAAHDLKVHIGWVVASYDLGEALANLVQPFWMLPVLGMLGLKARDVMGYTFVVFVVLLPVVLLLVTILNLTLNYPIS